MGWQAFLSFSLGSPPHPSGCCGNEGQKCFCVCTQSNYYGNGHYDELHLLNGGKPQKGSVKDMYMYVTGQNEIQVKIKFLCLLTLLIH